ncbi:MAG: phage tail tape measure protein [Spirochaetes bacterium]|nr:phage tail tape measure protein [Spirochaetota bacterium]MBN2771275.1 phage tail tape measure protein [Spirochaetota bacterium]
MSASGYYTFGAAITAKDLASNVFAKVGDNATRLKEQIGSIKGGVELYESSMKNLKVGGIMTAAGTGILMASKSMITAGREAGVLKSNLASLSLSEDAIKRIDKAAIGMGGSMGIARNDILAAAYDIKSGIETIDDNSIGAVAESVAKAAKATKGDAKQLSSFFGTVYNQNKKLYEGMSDENFANLFANNLSLSVKMYKTEGSKMQQAMESVSGVAAAAGYDMAEQFNVVGMLQNVLPEGEAGTGFRSFVNNIGSASKKLGVDLTDASGKALPVADILGKLHERFGNTIDSTENDLLRDAFTQEGMKLVTNLWDKTGKLNENIQAMREASGTDIVDAMAAANLNNIDTSIKKVSESWSNLKGVMGGGMGAALKPFFDILAKGLTVVAGFGAEHPKLMAFVGGFITLSGVVLTVGGAIIMAKGALGLYTLSQMAAAGATTVNTGATSAFSIATWAKTAATTASTVATKIAAVAQWALNSAFLACPITWIVVGLMAVVAAGIYVYKNWEMIKDKAVNAWNWIKTKWGEAPTWFKVVIGGAILAVTGPIGVLILAGVAVYKNWDLIKEKGAAAWGWIKGKWDSAVSFFTGLGEKIKTKLSEAWTGIKNKWSEAPVWMKLVIGGAILAITGPFGAVIAAGVAVYKNWDLIKSKGVGAWSLITGKINGAYHSFTSFTTGIKDKIMSIPETAKAAGSGLVTAFVSGFAEKVEWMKEKMSAGFGLVKKLFPHSDAPEGPFSTLTASGRAVVTTFESGIEKESSRKDPAVKPYMQKSMQSLQGYGSSEKTAQLTTNRGGLSLNIQQLVGTLNLNGENREGNIRELADSLAEYLFDLVERAHGTT